MEPGSSRQIGLVWRKASTRQDEFTMLGNFIQDNYKLSGNQSV
jgi:LysR family hydrogen peroxide-inducible transcriptional activator